MAGEGGDTPVFQPGNLAVELIQVNGEKAPKPPTPILIAAPTVAGTYPVAMCFHGLFIPSQFYSEVLKHCASFGFIMVAPQLQVNIFAPTSGEEEIASASKVIDWLPEGLPSVLPKGVKPDVSKLALAGQSGGGHTAFALALGYGKTSLRFSALIGLDPVAGLSKTSQVSPKILTYKPSSFNIDIYAGLGHHRHRAWRSEEMIPRHSSGVSARRGAAASKDPMRRTVAGITVAFLEATLSGQGDDLSAIMGNPGLAPTTLDPVELRY
ncbi:Chlorophyllase-1 [Dichanthelium oligosanthes]|uniref:Chlorophyllase-1 n=1 Tax=Dichanthelium oligosanthes TaxID=888268 RepID=A0A1E5WII0_9POAL|nr:Chlorophyllase-1 [Dichanthelium oligosanthes]